MNIIQTISNTLSGKNIVIVVIAFITFIARLFVDVSTFLFMFIGDMILALNSRYSECLADEYSYLIGFGEDLKSALYVISKISMPRRATLTERLKASHPYTTDRIERLENMLTQTA